MTKLATQDLFVRYGLTIWKCRTLANLIDEFSLMNINFLVRPNYLVENYLVLQVDNLILRLPSGD